MSQVSSKPADSKDSTAPNSKRTKVSKNPNDFDVFGFDMDLTLVQYHTVNLIEFVYAGLQNHLIEECGISRDVFLPVNQIEHMLFRGAVIDVDRGNVLQVDKSGVIAQAFYGLKSLSRVEIVELYGEGKWGEWDQVLQDHFIGSYPDPNKSTDATARTTYILDSEFDTPGTGIFSCVVESIKNSEPKSDDLKKEFNILWKNMARAFADVYKTDQESNSTISFYTQCKRKPETFIKKIGQKTIQCLRELKAKGKCVFLLTTSNYDFTDEILKVAYGDGWRELFSVVLTHAKKPSYFANKGQVLHRVSDDRCKLEACDAIEEGGMYTGGNVDYLNKFLSGQTHKEQPSVLYVGDNMRADIQGASKVANWKCGCLIENLPPKLETSPKNTIESEKFPDKFVPNSHISTRDGNNSFWFEKMLSLGYLLTPDMESLCEVLGGYVNVEESGKVMMGYNV